MFYLSFAVSRVAPSNNIFYTPFSVADFGTARNAFIQMDKPLISRLSHRRVLFPPRLAGSMHKRSRSRIRKVFATIAIDRFGRQSKVGVDATFSSAGSVHRDPRLRRQLELLRRRRRDSRRPRRQVISHRRTFEVEQKVAFQRFRDGDEDGGGS